VILLDTNVLLWLDRDDAQLGHQARKTIAQAWERCQVAVSVISFWEAAMLELPLEGGIALQAASLPPARSGTAPPASG
jgi:PIN domain nuclease of toxin-antitoxin system